MKYQVRLHLDDYGWKCWEVTWDNKVVGKGHCETWWGCKRSARKFVRRYGYEIRFTI